MRASAISTSAPSAVSLKLLVWNIRQGGGSRRPRIFESVAAYDPDIVVLLEFVSGPPSLPGFEHVVFNRSICIQSKMPIKMRKSGLPVLDESGKWLEVAVPSYGLTIAAVHAPTSPGAYMRDFLSALGQVAAFRRRRSFLFVGDFNTGIGPIDGPMKNKGDVDRFMQIQTNGFSDAWREIHGELVEYTYIFPRTGKSYRVDHALASSKLSPRIASCRYSHTERESGISDHSVLLLEINPALPKTRSGA